MAQPARGNDSSSRVRGEDFISWPLALCARRLGPQLALLPAAGPVSGGPENHGHVPCAHEDPEIGRCWMVDYDISDMASLDACIDMARWNTPDMTSHKVCARYTLRQALIRPA
jgi:hypothetical protein